MAGPDRLLEQRLDLSADVRVGVPGPCDFSVDVQRCIESSTAGAGDDDAALLRNQRAADVVGVACQRRWEAARGEQRAQQRSKVGDEAIVSGHQLVELASGRGVLVLEAVRLPRWVRSQRGADDVFVDRGELVARAGEET